MGPHFRAHFCIKIAKNGGAGIKAFRSGAGSVSVLAFGSAWASPSLRVRGASFDFEEILDEFFSVFRCVLALIWCIFLHLFWHLVCVWARCAASASHSFATPLPAGPSGSPRPHLGTPSSQNWSQNWFENGTLFWTLFFAGLGREKPSCARQLKDEGCELRFRRDSV